MSKRNPSPAADDGTSDSPADVVGVGGGVQVLVWRGESAESGPYCRGLWASQKLEQCLGGRRVPHGHGDVTSADHGRRRAVNGGEVEEFGVVADLGGASF